MLTLQHIAALSVGARAVRDATWSLLTPQRKGEGPPSLDASPAGPTPEGDVEIEISSDSERDEKRPVDQKNAPAAPVKNRSLLGAFCKASRVAPRHGIGDGLSDWIARLTGMFVGAGAQTFYNRQQLAPEDYPDWRLVIGGGVAAAGVIQCAASRRAASLVDAGLFQTPSLLRRVVLALASPVASLGCILAAKTWLKESGFVKTMANYMARTVRQSLRDFFTLPQRDYRGAVVGHEWQPGPVDPKAAPPLDAATQSRVDARRLKVATMFYFAWFMAQYFGFAGDLEKKLNHAMGLGPDAAKSTEFWTVFQTLIPAGLMAVVAEIWDGFNGIMSTAWGLHREGLDVTTKEGTAPTMAEVLELGSNHAAGRVWLGAVNDMGGVVKQIADQRLKDKDSPHPWWLKGLWGVAAGLQAVMELRGWMVNKGTAAEKRLRDQQAQRPAEKNQLEATMRENRQVIVEMQRLQPSSGAAQAPRASASRAAAEDSMHEVRGRAAVYIDDDCRRLTPVRMRMSEPAAEALTPVPGTSHGGMAVYVMDSKLDDAQRHRLEDVRVVKIKPESQGWFGLPPVPGRPGLYLVATREVHALSPDDPDSLLDESGSRLPERKERPSASEDD